MTNSLKLKRGNKIDQARTCLHFEATAGDGKPSNLGKQQREERSTYSPHLNFTLKYFQLLWCEYLFWRPPWLLVQVPLGRLPIHAAAHQFAGTPGRVLNIFSEHRASLCIHGPLNLAGRCPYTIPHKHTLRRRINSFGTASYQRNLVHKILQG